MNVYDVRQSNRTTDLHRPAINSMTFGGSTLMRSDSKLTAMLLICLKVIIVPHNKEISHMDENGMVVLCTLQCGYIALTYHL